MQDSTSELTPNQVAAMTELLAGRTVRASAKAAGVDAATVHRWMNDPTFRAAQQAGRRELAQQALGQLQGITAIAVGVIKDLMMGCLASFIAISTCSAAARP